MSKSIIVFLIYSSFLFSQREGKAQENELIQYSGYTLVKDGDSIRPASFIFVRNKSRNSGSYSKPDGFFSIVAQRGDTIIFTSIGFKKSTLIIPDNIRSPKFTANQIMIRESTKLPETIIVPWKNIDELKQAFLDLKVNEDDLVIAYQNLQMERWEKLRQTLPMDATESHRYTLINQNQNNLLQHGITPMNNLLNPVAWYQFINMITNQKKKKKEAVGSDKYQEE